MLRLPLALAALALVALAAPTAIGSATPAPKRTLKVVVVGGGSVLSSPRGVACPPKCSARFASGARVTLRARPDPGFVFARWRGACTVRGLCTVALRGPRTVVAIFDIEEEPPAEPPPPPQPPPPPPPPPAALPGHYVGKTSHLTDVSFDVVADSSRLENFSTGQINQSCTPPAHLSGGGFAGARFSIGFDGAFGWSGSVPGTVGGWPANYAVSIQGRFAAGVATGTIRVGTTFPHPDGTHYSCDSDVVTFTATRTG